MPSDQEDLDLLLSLPDHVPETPPGSPSTANSPFQGYLSDGGVRRPRDPPDLSVFRDVVQDCLDLEPKHVHHAAEKTDRLKNSNEFDLEKYSGLRIRNQLVTRSELCDRLSDIRFVRLPTIKHLLMGDTLSGCWATVGVLIEKGSPKTSSVGKTYCIWKLGCLDENSVSLFLFGDAHHHNSRESAGTVFAIFNSAVRKDNTGASFSLSVSCRSQMLKMGTSIDYGVCKGKRKDGMACTMVVNKRQGVYCRYHKSKASERYSTVRTELKGGNLRAAFKDSHRSQGIYLVDPLADKTNLKQKRCRVLSVEELKKTLSKASKVTTNPHSQGIKFLKDTTEKMSSNLSPQVSTTPQANVPCKRKSWSSKLGAFGKRKKSGSPDNGKHSAGRMIELDVVSSDEEMMTY